MSVFASYKVFPCIFEHVLLLKQLKTFAQYCVTDIVLQKRVRHVHKCHFSEDTSAIKTVRPATNTPLSMLFIYKLDTAPL